MQLVAFGAQDIYLTGNPQITFFKVVYRRHTNFSMEAIRQTWNGSAKAGSRLSATISRNGDLIGATYLEFLNCNWNRLCHNPGAQAINTIECEIGGQLIDRHYGHWMETWTELTQPGLGNLTIGAQPSAKQTAAVGGAAANNVISNIASTATPNIAGGSFVAGSLTGATVTACAITPAAIGTNLELTTALAEAGSTVSTTLATAINSAVILSVNSLQNSINDDVSAATGSGGEMYNLGRCIKDVATRPSHTHTGQNQHITHGNRFQNSTGMGGVYCGNTEHGADLKNVLPLTVPLYFWFCRNPGLALPLIALQYHEVKIILQLSDKGGGTNGWSGPETGGYVDLWVDYIYLDTDERRRFAQVSHEYLIEQVQYQTIGTTQGSHDLNFNHPVKELIWTGAWTENGTYTGGGGGGTDLGSISGVAPYGVKWGLKLNGHDRFEPRLHTYFSKTQVLQHHSGWGMVANDNKGVTQDEICVYSFALKPEEHQPSGTCNFSRIDSAQLMIVGRDAGSAANVYAVNYNVLRIMSGMGGLAYSN